MKLVKGDRTEVLTDPVWIAVFKANGFTEVPEEAPAKAPAKAPRKAR